MSYCRWSCDGFKSDVYVYQNEDDFYSVRIKKQRSVINDDAPLLIEFDGTNAPEAYASQLNYSRWLNDRPRINIIQKYAGETLHFDDIPATIHFLHKLRDLKYHVPEHAFDRLHFDYTSEKDTNGLQL